MAIISMKQLLEAGVHFGHQTRRWNPKMIRFIFTERNGIYILDLQKTVSQLKEAYNIVKEAALKGGKILFVGTKKQSQEAIYEEAVRCGAFYVKERWLGGMLTNFSTIRKRIAYLLKIEKMKEDGTYQALTKKEVSHLEKERERLERFFGGIKQMNKLPQVLFVSDPNKEKNAVREARKLGITVIAICDTNSDPDEVDIPIPGNDDAIRSVKLLASVIADAALAAQTELEGQAKDAEEQQQQQELMAKDEKEEEMV